MLYVRKPLSCTVSPLLQQETGNREETANGEETAGSR